jgi:hypothetical protein
MVSSMRDLLRAVRWRIVRLWQSNQRATRRGTRLAVCALVTILATSASARESHAQAEPLTFLAGAAIGLAAHEAGHLLFDVVFDADPGVRRVEFRGIPFFALTHRGDLSPRREFTISSAGFWVQHAVNEWLLTHRPRLRHERAPLLKGMFAFNVVASVAYSGAAFAKEGPPERDTRGMAASLGEDERWMGALILAPALLDTWRYFDPDARVPVWISRAVKVGAVLLVFKAQE